MKSKRNFRRMVLIVDDEMVNRQLLGFIISKEYDVIYAENGVEALEKIKENSKMLSLVLLDLLMPEMNGYELLEVLQKDEKLRRIPVIVLTSEKKAEVKSLELGAVDFISKPYDMPDVILARVNRSVEFSEDTTIIQNTETDELTGLYTREFFFEYANQFDKYHPDLSMEAIVINVSRFHLLNELYGRSYGDKVLRNIAIGLKKELEGKEGIAGRIGTDSFYLYISGIDDHDKLLERIMIEVLEESEFARVHLRMGVYPVENRKVEMERRFDRAVLACNKLRNNYTQSYTIYDTQMQEKEVFLECLVNGVDEAITKKQFKVYYQPKYSIQGDRPVLSSAEALIRWIHPIFGMVSPGTFIPLFEENGLVQRLDRYVWNEAAEQIKKWKDEFGIIVPISVNVSRIDIYDPNLEQELLDIVEKNGITPKDYLLEITESAYTDNSDQIVDVVEKLRKHGFRVEMDDFGSGYSSLNMLTVLPIDVIKLDMKFIRNIANNEKDFRMVELMMEIADFLSVPVVAEGVEEEVQYDLLKKAGCDVIQGYYFSKPVPAEEFEEFIKKEIEK